MNKAKQRIILPLVLLAAILLLTACDGQGDAYNFVQSSGTVAYAQLVNMTLEPQKYVGAAVTVRGQCASSYYPVTDLTYYSVVVSDVSVCCSQGIEYLLSGGDYPADGTEATVTGEFEVYYENGIPYCRLKDAEIITNEGDYTT